MELQTEIKNKPLLEQIGEEILKLIERKSSDLSAEVVFTDITKGTNDRPLKSGEIAVLAYAEYIEPDRLTPTGQKTSAFEVSLVMDREGNKQYLTFFDTGTRMRLLNNTLVAVLSDINGADMAMRKHTQRSEQSGKPFFHADHSHRLFLDTSDPQKITVAMNRILPHYGLEPIDLGRTR